MGRRLVLAAVAVASAHAYAPGVTVGHPGPAVNAMRPAAAVSAMRVDAPARMDSSFGVVEDYSVPSGGFAFTPFTKLMAANRAEIAVRIMRAATELNLPTLAIYGFEDRYCQHRWGADQSVMLQKEEATSPVQAYLDIEQIIAIALKEGVDAIHPGYGFLSESPEFAQACEDAGITFVGPTVENLNTFSDKTNARKAAIAANVPVVPGAPPRCRPCVPPCSA